MSAVDDAADRAVASVRAAYDQLKSATDPGWFASDAQKQVWGDVKALGPQIDAWAGPWRRWAENGVRDDGTAYTWAMWSDFGSNTLASAIQSYGAYYVDGSSLRAVVDASLQTASDVADKAGGLAETIGHLALSPWVWWVGGAVVLLLAVGPFVAPLIRRAE